LTNTNEVWTNEQRRLVSTVDFYPTFAYLSLLGQAPQLNIPTSRMIRKREVFPNSQTPWLPVSIPIAAGSTRPRSASRKRKLLTDDERKKISSYSKKNPRVTHEKLAGIYASLVLSLFTESISQAYSSVNEGVV